MQQQIVKNPEESAKTGALHKAENQKAENQKAENQKAENQKAENQRAENQKAENQKTTMNGNIKFDPLDVLQH